jgi:hypothetical protein
MPFSRAKNVHIQVRIEAASDDNSHAEAEFPYTRKNSTRLSAIYVTD